MAYATSVPVTRLVFSDGFNYYGAGTTVAVSATVNLSVPSATHTATGETLTDGQLIPAQNAAAFDVPRVSRSGWVTPTGSTLGGWSYDLALTITATGKPKLLWSGTITPREDTTVVTPGMGSVTSGGASGSTTVPNLLPAVRAMQAGQSTGIWFTGDSTGDGDGVDPAQDRIAARFARKLGEAYPGHHVLFKDWDAATEDYKPWTTIQAHADGRRYVNITTRTLRYRHDDVSVAQVNSNVLDVRVLVSFATLNPDTARAIVTRSRKEVDGVLSNDLQFNLRLHPTGALYLAHSENGTSFLSDRVSDVPLSDVATVGVPLWVRAVLEIVPGTGFNVKFYTSPAEDGVTWTQLGGTKTGGGTSTLGLYQAAQGSFFEVGGRAWQPTDSPLTGAKIYETQIRDGAGGRMLAPGALEFWERYGDSATTFGGAPTLYFINASHAGSDMAYHKNPTRLPKATPDYGQSVLIFNDSHNEVSKAGSLWITPFEEWVNMVQARTPNTAVNVIGQNPHTADWGNEAAYGAEHVKRIMELSAVSARKNWGFINVYQSFLDDSRGLGALITSDGLHPTQAGYELGGDTVAAAAGVA